jgi:hypothetical protein
MSDLMLPLEFSEETVCFSPASTASIESEESASEKVGDISRLIGNKKQCFAKKK